MIHISIWGIEAFSEGLSGDGTGILGPLRQRAPPNWGYGVRLVRLCLVDAGCKACERIVRSLLFIA